MKQDLKTRLKPLIKECLQEVLLEQGMLSTLISEVVKGLQVAPVQSAPLVENTTPELADTGAQLERQRLAEERYAAMREQKKKLLDAAGFGGIDVFEGVEPLAEAGRPDAAPSTGPLSGVAPGDAGVDISQLAALSRHDWRKMI